jgi:hypothetical protein
VRKLFALIARSHQMLADLQEALRTCARRLAADPEDAELWFRTLARRSPKFGNHWQRCYRQ